MKKKILIGAIALMSVLGGITIFESISGQNEAKAGTFVIKGHKNMDGTCHFFGDRCTKVYIEIKK